MGPPGAGKTNSAKMLAAKLGKKSFDVDDDILEVLWEMPVSDKLKEVGNSCKKDEPEIF